MLVILSNSNRSSHCIYHIEDNFYQHYHYIWGISQSSWLQYLSRGKVKGGWEWNTTVSKINTYSDNSALELTQYNYTQVLNIWVDSDLCQRKLNRSALTVSNTNNWTCVN